MKKIKFTKTNIERLPVPDKKKKYQDIDNKYLHLIITPKNSRTYYYIRCINGRPKYIKIASYGEVSIKAAQHRCIGISNDVMCGIDTKQKERQDITLEETNNYWLQHRKKTKGWHKDIKECRSRFEKYVPLKLKKKKVTDIDRSEIRRLHLKIRDEIGAHTANRLLQCIGASINLLIKHDFGILQNPAAMIELFKERSRSRFIKEDEVERFFTELMKSASQDFKDFVLIALFTSKRKSNVLAAEWSEIDFNKSLWTIPGKKTKNGDDDVTVLDDAVLNIFKRRKQAQESIGVETNWVFHSRDSQNGHYRNPAKPWHNLLKRAGIEDLRIHDLRRTLASWMANQNVSLHMIASILGQKSTGVTPTYARLSVDPKREAVSNAVAEMLKVGKLKLGDNGLEFDEVRKKVQEIAEILIETPSLIGGVREFINNQTL
ncbi:tyrosine-type recombinase/integrase [Lentisphaerota bacterium ZTH]|nr:tyrosine-type recombinase/integrase [Lentisphaerota bacterium]WET07496.1 tyrosine-type recombinase/integrase [Lentisphaerota bacterium ZTH]